MRSHAALVTVALVLVVPFALAAPAEARDVPLTRSSLSFADGDGYGRFGADRARNQVLERPRAHVVARARDRSGIRTC